MARNGERRLAGWRARWHEIIFDADTPAGKAFDVGLLLAIMLSVVVVCLESVESWSVALGPALRVVEWVLTVLFTFEYCMRLLCVTRPARYARSFFGVVDLLSVLPTYVGLFVDGAQSLLVIRVLRMLRVFRVLKLAGFVSEAQVLIAAIRSSMKKITVFMGTVLTLVVIVGAVMYLVEGPEHGFTSIPQSMYWAVVTMTTVGYGDITPGTVAGKTIATFVMMMGYGILAVPTGIVSVEIAQATNRPITTRSCEACSAEGHHPAAVFCMACGERL